MEIPAQPDLGVPLSHDISSKRLDVGFSSLPPHRMMATAILACSSASETKPKHNEIALL